MADREGLLLLDLKDLKALLNHFKEHPDILGEDRALFTPASSQALLRRLALLEQQGAEIFFGEKSFEVDDLVRLDENGKGIVSILRLTDIQDRPKLFSTFMLSLLAEVYATFPEEGDADQPKLAIFIDEAHLIFE